jgi:hypothetical protein
MLAAGTGVMRLRATGEIGVCPGPKCVKRSIIASLRRKSFLDYIYFTAYETTDPATYPPSQIAAANTYCGAKYRPQRAVGCKEIQFTATDHVDGPFHTNDDILTCNGATFGRTAADRLEASGAAPGWKNVCGSTPPNFKATWQAGVSYLDVPSSNVKITNEATPAYTFTGTTKLNFVGGQIEVTPAGQAMRTMPMPSNGVIWVKGGSGCGAGVVPSMQDYNEPLGCANAYVSGSYSSSMTIVSDKDIIVRGNFTHSGVGAIAGLVATNYVRVYHPVINRQLYTSGTDSGQTSDCDNATSTSTGGSGQPPVPAYGFSTQDVTIDAAILSLSHSFIVDNHSCGNQLGTLSVFGAIAQKYRGPVGTTQGSGSVTGYTKNYDYDDRLKFRNPPFFLDPVSAAWRVVRVNEQVPAT